MKEHSLSRDTLLQKRKGDFGENKVQRLIKA